MSLLVTAKVKKLLIEALEIPPGLTTPQAIQLSEGKKALVIKDRGRFTGVILPEPLSGRDAAVKKLDSFINRDFTMLDEGYLDMEVDVLWNMPGANILVITGEGGQVAGVICPWVLGRNMYNEYLAAQARLSTVLDTVSEAVCIVDEENNVVAWNRRAQHLYGIDAETILGQRVDRFFSNIIVTNVIKQRREVRSTYHQPCRDTHVLINASPVRFKGLVMGGVSAERDISEVVQLNQELSRTSNQVKLLEEELNKISTGYNPFLRIFGHNKYLRDVVAMAGRIAATNAAVLIKGEPGTGKKLLARSIHEAGPNTDKPFVIIDCPSIDISYLESLMKSKDASCARGGTIYLNDVHELNYETQAKLVNIISNELSSVGIRVISSANIDMGLLLEKNILREDLYYLINVVTLELPALRNRREDIPELSYLFLQEFSNQYNKVINKIESGALSALISHAWPGNIQELRNVIQRMVVLAEGEAIGEDCIPANIKIPASRRKTPELPTLNSVTEQTERELILDMLRETQGNRSEAARRLGIPRSTLYYKMHQLGLL